MAKELSDKPAQTEGQLFDLVYRDDLTGLLNRRFFREQIDKDSQALKEKPGDYSFLMFDIDHFKSINDGYSHQEGDVVLKEVAELFRDSIGEKGLAIRYAGDEFVALLPGLPKPEAKDLALELKNIVSSHSIHLPSVNESLRVTLSIGVAHCPDDTAHAQELVQLADEAAYISKKKGRNSVSTIDEKRTEDIEVRFLHRYFPCKKFVGREELVQRLKRLALPTSSESKPIVMIEGPHGIGKSRLLSEIAQAFDPVRNLHLRCHCQHITAAQPFWEVTDTLNRKLTEAQELASTVANRLSRQKLREIVPLMPVFAPYYVQPAEGPEISAQQRKEILLEAIEEVFLTISENKPLAISIDDFQWSNLGTQMLIERLKSNPKADRIPIFISLNSDELLASKDTDLLEYLRRLEEKSVMTRYRLEMLEKDEIEKLVASIIPGLEVNKDVVKIIRERSKGLPLLVEDIIKLLIYRNIIHTREGVLIVEPFEADSIPVNIEEAFNPGIQQLDEEVKGLLCRASVIGERFNIDLLKQVDGRSEAFVQDILEKAQKAALITNDPINEPDTFIFSSNKTHSSVYESITDDEKKVYHKQLAEIEWQIHKEEIETVLSKIAYHFKQSGDEAKAQQYFNQLLGNYENFLSPKVIELYVGRAPVKKEWESEKELTEEEEALAFQFLKLIQITLGNLQNFPIESEIVKGSFESTYWELKKLFEKIEIVTFSDGDGELLINSKRPSSSDKDRTSEEKFLQAISKAGLKGITIKKEITKEQFLRFLRMVIIEKHDDIEQKGGWTEVLTREGITSVITNERIFISVAERDLFDPKRLKEEVVVIKKIETEDNAPPSPLTEGERREQASTIAGNIYEQLQQIKEGVLKDESLGEDVEKIRDLLERIFEKHVGIEKLIESIMPRLGQEEAPGLSAPGKVPYSQTYEPHSETMGELSILVRKLDILTFAKFRVEPEFLVKDLESGDDEISSSSAVALGKKGQESIPAIISFLKATESPLGRKRAFHLLKRLAPRAEQLLIDDLMGATSAEEKKHIIEVLHDSAGIDILGALRYYLRSPQNEVRQAVINLLCSRPTDKTEDLLLEILNDPVTEENLPIVRDVIEAMGRMKMTRAVEPLSKMLRKRDILLYDVSHEVQEAACLALGKIGSPESLPHLIRAVKKSPFYFLMRLKAARVRAAAAFALSAFPSQEVKALLRETAKDPLPDVRSAASLALHNIEMEGALPKLDKPILAEEPPDKPDKGKRG
ncbi:MAG: diguanylate cyclase [Candidatus Eremiobacteraeota bacterium]|nr:diguanylate cyclase [Candidatus Eremiobacteraeota bacterium]